MGSMQEIAGTLDGALDIDKKQETELQPSSLPTEGGSLHEQSKKPLTALPLAPKDESYGFRLSITAALWK